ncbi:MAG: MBL fold metallo-hydrolase [Eggerthellaceae bacterium]|nr:MBL fold metallo-hydrolase [Eggerthellaceae bacterium]
MASPCVSIERIVLGPIDNNVYLIGDGSSMVLVDPSCREKDILAFLDGRMPDAIFVTHAHYDHIGALAALRAATGAPVYASAAEEPLINGSNPSWNSRHGVEPCPVDYVVSDGDVLAIGNMMWKAMITPGHSQGSTCFLLENVRACGVEDSSASILVSGDTLFEGTIGRTDFEGGDFQAMRRSLARLAALQDETIVLPGHGNPTTIDAERIRVFKRYC